MKYYVVDAFAERLFTGNPAGVCLPEQELSRELMQQIAAENNLAETAFLLGREGEYRLRWFTPETEIDLCGHATLASAFVVMNFISPGRTEVRFETASGPLTVKREEEVYTMDFPSRMPRPVEKHGLLERALNCRVLETHLARDLVAVVESETAVRNLHVNIPLLSEISRDLAFAVVVTAKGETCDFVSRFFAPNAGVAEDPVTGSSHSTLIPFWQERLGKRKMVARQLSARDGTLWCESLGSRVRIGGTAVCYLQGEIGVLK